MSYSGQAIYLNRLTQFFSKVLVVVFLVRQEVQWVLGRVVSWTLTAL